MVPSEKKLLSLLSNNDVTFFIPPYQRNYEWTDEQCKVFLEDVIKTRDANKVGKHIEYFFGSVTYFQSEQSVFGQPSRLILIDGQQRITTTMLFLIAVRDLLEKDDQKKFINNRYLKNNAVEGATEYKIKLKQVESDWETYKNIVLGEPIPEEGKNCAVYRNYSFFKNRLSVLMKDDPNITSYVEYGLQNFSVVTLELQPRQNPWENPQEIFESMNSIGKPLSLADLVRNYLLLGLDADTQDDLYHRYWLKIEKTVPGTISNFVRDYMQGVEGKPFKQAKEANYKELYSQFKEMFAGFDAETLLKSLSDYAVTYSYVTRDVSTGSAKIDAELRDLRVVNVTVAYSFLMMLVQEWIEKRIGEKDLVDALSAFKIYCYRRRILAISQGENKTFPTLVKRIPDIVSSVDKKNAMFRLLAKQENTMRVPNDLEMTRFMETMNFYNFRYCKFFLALVEEYLTKCRPDLTDKHLQIEHIMPQKLNEEWIEALGKDFDRIHQEYVGQIGNLTLIRHNQELGNSAFNKKKEVYENNAGLQIAKTNITNRAQWDKRSIQNRSKWIISTIVEKVIPIPEDMKKTNNFIPKSNRHLSFGELQMKDSIITFTEDPSIEATVVSEKCVEFEGKIWQLSDLTKELLTRKGIKFKSIQYSGAAYWEFDGIRLIDII